MDIFDFLKIAAGRKILDAYLEENKPKILENQCLSCHNHNKIVISAKGDVFLCSMYESDDTTLGNLHEKDFYEIWENRFNTPYFQNVTFLQQNVKTVNTLPCAVLAAWQVHTRNMVI